MDIEYTTTGRGFAVATFADRYGQACSIQKSSLATEDAIWFGLDDAEPVVLHGDAAKVGVHTTATEGWVPYPIPKEVLIATRMHLTRDQVRELLPILKRFVATGEVLP
jgi:hypothetical protein